MEQLRSAPSKLLPSVKLMTPVPSASPAGRYTRPGSACPEPFCCRACSEVFHAWYLRVVQSRWYNDLFICMLLCVFVYVRVMYVHIHTCEGTRKQAQSGPHLPEIRASTAMFMSPLAMVNAPFASASLQHATATTLLTTLSSRRGADVSICPAPCPCPCPCPCLPCACTPPL
jgi:hypothetical protein